MKIPEQTIRLGKRNQLTVLREVDFGVYLDGGDIGDILLPKRYVPANCKVGDIVDVEVLSVDEKKGRISLTMKLGSKNS